MLYLYILKRKRNATVFNPPFLQHGPYEAYFLIISCVPAHRVMICHKMVFDHDFHSDVIMTSAYFNKWGLKVMSHSI